MPYYPDELAVEYPRHQFETVGGRWDQRQWKCPICGKGIAPRGMNQHLRWHAKKGEIKAIEVEVVRTETVYDLGDGTFFQH